MAPVWRWYPYWRKRLLFPSSLGCYQRLVPLPERWSPPAEQSSPAAATAGLEESCSLVVHCCLCNRCLFVLEESPPCPFPPKLALLEEHCPLAACLQLGFAVVGSTARAIPLPDAASWEGGTRLIPGRGCSGEGGAFPDLLGPTLLSAGKGCGVFGLLLSGNGSYTLGVS